MTRYFIQFEMRDRSKGIKPIEPAKMDSTMVAIGTLVAESKADGQKVRQLHKESP
jgi:hypothetical protein